MTNKNNNKDNNNQVMWWPDLNMNEIAVHLRGLSDEWNTLDMCIIHMNEQLFDLAF